ncbi:hypothetical protein [Streptomyces flaveolus]|uniref:hypothetical protein n=1 Tax=Streptomyces flaveolus TaxID=67297 RepID=UPI0036FFAB67
MTTEYEGAVQPSRALLEDLTPERLEVLELADSDAPAALVAELLGVLADWQQRLQQLQADASNSPEMLPYLTEQQAAYEDAYARTNAAFVGWYFSGWATMPTANTAMEAQR